MLHATIRKVVPQDDTQGDTQDGKITGNQINKGGTQDVPQGKLDDWITEQIRKNPNITTEELAILSGKGVRTIKRRISKLPHIEYVGSGYSGHWKIIDTHK